MPFGFGKKEETPASSDNKEIDDADEIKKIASRLDSDERVLVVAKQSRIKPGGSMMTPSILFATNKRLLIRDPTMLGLRESIEDITYSNITSARLQKGVFSSSIMLRAAGLSTLSEKRMSWLVFAKGSNEGEIDAIPKDKAEKIVEIIKKGIDEAKSTQTSPKPTQSSIADELTKLAKLKAEGVISDEEFQTLKAELMSKKS